MGEGDSTLFYIAIAENPNVAVLVLRGTNNDDQLMLQITTAFSHRATIEKWSEPDQNGNREKETLGNAHPYNYYLARQLMGDDINSMRQEIKEELQEEKKSWWSGKTLIQKIKAHKLRSKFKDRKLLKTKSRERKGPIEGGRP